MNVEDQPVERLSCRSGVVAAAFVLALALGAGSFFFGKAIERGLESRNAPRRSVTVKGLSERQVRADLALWPLRFVEASDELQAAQTRVENDQKLVADLLKAQGLKDGEITIQRTDVVDLLAREYRNETTQNVRFIVYGNVMIRTENVEAAQQASHALTDLVKNGVVFTTEGPGSPASLTPYFLFTKINDVKLEMLAEATKNARAAANQFAQDSNTSLGVLVKANQGSFSILPGDLFPGATEESQITKTVRVVSTLEFLLGNSAPSPDWLIQK